MIPDIDLDHVAVAAERQQDAWPRYTGDLAADWVSGGDSTGFSSAQVRFANDMKLEVLEPHRVEDNDFLRRFLDANGPGPHHLTFKVADFDAALAAATEAGIEPVGIDRSDPGWQEMFLHPKQALGVVVQLARSDGSAWESDPPADLPAPRTEVRAALEHITHVVASLDDGLALFADLLGGRRTGDGTLEGGRYVDLAWTGPGRVRLVAPEPGDDRSPWASYLDGRSGRVHHLAFLVDDPAAVPGAVPARDDTWVVAPERNLGVRLVLRAAP